MLARTALGMALLLAPAALARTALAETPPGPPAGSGETRDQIRLNRPSGGGDQPAGPAQPGPALLADISPEEAAGILESAGFPSVGVVEDADGNYVRLRSDSGDSFVFLHNCTNGRCRSLMFTAFLASRRGASLNFVNGYNLKTLHTKMARNDSGEIVLTMAASLVNGVSAAHLRTLGSFWIQVHRDALAWR